MNTQLQDEQSRISQAPKPRRLIPNFLLEQQFGYSKQLPTNRSQGRLPIGDLSKHNLVIEKPPVYVTEANLQTFLPGIKASREVYSVYNYSNRNFGRACDRPFMKPSQMSEIQMLGRMRPVKLPAIIRKDLVPTNQTFSGSLPVEQHKPSGLDPNLAELTFIQQRVKFQGEEYTVLLKGYRLECCNLQDIRILDGIDTANNLDVLREPEVIDYALKWKDTFEIFTLSDAMILEVMKSSVKSVEEDEKYKGNMSKSIKFKLDYSQIQQTRSSSAHTTPKNPRPSTSSSVRDKMQLGNVNYYIVVNFPTVEVWTKQKERLINRRLIREELQFLWETGMQNLVPLVESATKMSKDLNWPRTRSYHEFETKPYLQLMGMGDDEFGERERVLVILTAEGTQRGLIGKTLAVFEAKGLQLVAMKMMTPRADVVHRYVLSHNYQVPTSNRIDGLTGGPIVAMVWQGFESVRIAQQLMTKMPGVAMVERGRLATVIVSHRVANVTAEVNAFFDERELCEWRTGDGVNGGMSQSPSKDEKKTLLVIPRAGGPGYSVEPNQLMQPRVGSIALSRIMAPSPDPKTLESLGNEEHTNTQMSLIHAMEPGQVASYRGMRVVITEASDSARSRRLDETSIKKTVHSGANYYVVTFTTIQIESIDEAPVFRTCNLSLEELRKLLRLAITKQQNLNEILRGCVRFEKLPMREHSKRQSHALVYHLFCDLPDDERDTGHPFSVTPEAAQTIGLGVEGVVELHEFKDGKAIIHKARVKHCTFEVYDQSQKETKTIAVDYLTLNEILMRNFNFGIQLIT